MLALYSDEKINAMGVSTRSSTDDVSFTHSENEDAETLLGRVQQNQRGKCSFPTVLHWLFHIIMAVIIFIALNRTVNRSTSRHQQCVRSERAYCTITITFRSSMS